MIDGTFNDLDDPVMGSTGSRFGRNFPLEHTFPEQEPREKLVQCALFLSRRLLAVVC